MDLNKEKIPSPFKAPDGYFNDFEKRLSEKIGTQKQSQLRKSNGRYVIGEYLAIAATLAAILVTAWVVFYKSDKPAPQIAKAIVVPPIKKDTIAVLSDSAIAETLATRVVEEILEQPENINPVGYFAETKMLGAKDEAIARELEDAGLIVLDAHDGLFDTFEL